MRSGPRTGRRGIVLEVYARLRRRWGHAGWWPGDSAFEVCLGAILTQGTSWRNVEKALESLRRKGRLSFETLHGLPPSKLAPWIRSSGYFRVKARRICAFLDFLAREYKGRVGSMSREPVHDLRSKLLSVRGVGPETADSIILYAAGLPSFVVDAYTRRIFSRLGVLEGGEGYEAVQQRLTSALPKDVALYNDYHAQLVRLGKEICRPRPRCGVCPLDELCPKKGVLG